MVHHYFETDVNLRNPHWYRNVSTSLVPGRTHTRYLLGSSRRHSWPIASAHHLWDIGVTVITFIMPLWVTNILGWLCTRYLHMQLWDRRMCHQAVTVTLKQHVVPRLNQECTNSVVPAGRLSQPCANHTRVWWASGCCACVTGHTVPLPLRPVR